MKSDELISGLFRAQGSPYRPPFHFEGRPLDEAEVWAVLNLDLPAMNEVHAAHAADDHEKAAGALRTYFRRRDTVAWPAWPALENHTHFLDPNKVPPCPTSFEAPPGPVAASAMPRLSMDALDETQAARAARHIFQTFPGYEPCDYGPEIDWDADPYQTISWMTCMHRMLSWDLSAARCYNRTGNERYAQTWWELTRDWIRKNSVTAERCHYPRSWDAIQVGERARRWCGLLPYFLNAEACSPEGLLELLAALYNHARRIVVLPYPMPDNFLMIESAGLAQIALTFPEFRDAPEWLKIACARLPQALNQQVLPDGVQHELAPGYHLYCTVLYLDVIDQARRNGRDTPFGPRVEAMAHALMALSSPLRRTPIVGDTLRSDTQPALARAGRLFQRADFLAVATEGQQGQWPAARQFAFRDGGFYAFRSSWAADGIWLALHCGPRSGEPTECHAQPDNGTFELAAFGRYLMRDPGVFSYNWNDPAERAPFRATAAHQTLTLDNANSARAGRCLGWCADDGGGNAWLTVENRAYPNLVHRRTVFFIRKRWFVLVDEALGEAAGAIALHFRLTPGPAMLDPEQKRAWTTFAEGGNVLVWADPAAPVAMCQETAWFSPELSRKEPLPAFCYQATQAAPVRFLTVLAPFKDAQRPTVSNLSIEGDVGGPRLTLRGKIADTDFSVGRLLESRQYHSQSVKPGLRVS